MSELIKNLSSNKFSFVLRLKSFTYAWSGIKNMLVNEHNSRVHLAFTIGVLLLSFIFHPSTTELLLLLIVIAIVWIAELFNTCIEKIMDYITLKKNLQIQRIKDMAAGAVLLASVTAFLVGAIVFIPKILKYVSFIL